MFEDLEKTFSKRVEDRVLNTGEGYRPISEHCGPTSSSTQWRKYNYSTPPKNPKFASKECHKQVTSAQFPQRHSWVLDFTG